MNQNKEKIPTNFIQTAIIRHGESYFNIINDSFLQKTGQDVVSQLAKRTFQFDRTLIDSGLTEIGKQQAIQAQNRFDKGQIDIVFVSPLKRTLQTADLIFKNKTTRFIVLPQLTEILSKICDISSSIEQKKILFPQMDFSHFDNKQSTWQLDLLPDRERQRAKMLSSQTPTNQQITNYLYQLIQHHFPSSSQYRPDCSIRCKKVKQKISSISKQFKASKVAIVAHRRVILQMTKNQQHPQGIVMKNCQSQIILL